MKLVEKIMSILKLDEAGKISKFFESLVKDSKRAIAQLESNKKAAAIEYEQEKDELTEQLEDAREAVEAAYENVTLENVKNNEAINRYKEIYLEGISSAEDKVKYFEEELSDLEEEYNSNIEAIEEQIAKYKALIARFG